MSLIESVTDKEPKPARKRGGGQSEMEVLEAFIESRWELRHNTVLSCIEYKDMMGDSGWQRMTDRASNSMLREARHHGLKVNATVLGEILESDFTELYNPFIEYFNSLPAYDGKEYIKQLAATLTLKDKSEQKQLEKYLAKWMIAAVACAIDSEHINETALVLIGEQGDGKTRWFRRLVPGPLANYQYTGLVRTDDKDSKVHLSECFIINLDELATIGKNDIESLKSLFSEKQIRMRRSYARFADVYDRRASFVGSGNSAQFLSDPTGSRRFLVFDVEYSDYLHMVDIDRCYAEALHRFKQGEQYWLSRDEIKEVNDKNEAHQIASTENELLSKYITKGNDFMTTTDIVRSINEQEQELSGRAGIMLSPTQATLKKIGSAMAGLGYKRTQRRINGKPVYGYECGAVKRAPMPSELAPEAPW